jgi:hypothetical protein
MNKIEFIEQALEDEEFFIAKKKHIVDIREDEYPSFDFEKDIFNQVKNC